MMIIGIAHQTAWLAISPKPLFHQRPQEMARSRARNLRSIGIALTVYATAHGNRYPDDLYELMKGEYGLSPEDRSYLYFCKGHTTADADAVIGLDPPANHDDEGALVLFGDRHVEWIEIDKAGDILLQHGFERIDPAGSAYSPKRNANP